MLYPSAVRVTHVKSGHSVWQPPVLPGRRCPHQWWVRQVWLWSSDHMMHEVQRCWKLLFLQWSNGVQVSASIGLLTPSGISGSTLNSCTSTLATSSCPQMAAWCSAVKPSWGKRTHTWQHVVQNQSIQGMHIYIYNSVCVFVCSRSTPKLRQEWSPKSQEL